MNPPGDYHKSDEARDWEKPAQIHQGFDKPAKANLLFVTK